MIYTTSLLSNPLSTNIDSLVNFFATRHNCNLRKKDLLNHIAEECFTLPSSIIRVKNITELQRAICFAISAKYATEDSLATLNDLFIRAEYYFKQKLLPLLILATESLQPEIASHFFDKLNADSLYANSINPDFSHALRFLFARYQLPDQAPYSLFEFIAREEPFILQLLKELGADDLILSKLLTAAKKHFGNSPNQSIAQFYHQSLEQTQKDPLYPVGFDCICRQKTDNIISQDQWKAKHSCNSSQSGSASSLHHDAAARQNELYYGFRYKRLFLTYNQKDMISTLGCLASNDKNLTFKSAENKAALKNIFTKIAQEWLIEFNAFSKEIEKITNPKVLEKLKNAINQDLKHYLTTRSKKEKSLIAETLATRLVTLCSQELKRNKVALRINKEAQETMRQVLEKGNIRCRALYNQ